MSTYPRPLAQPSAPFDALNEKTLARVAAHILSWQQGPGDFGGIHHHACWGDSSALARRYQGSTTWSTSVFMQGVQTIARRRGCPWWQHLAHSLAAQLLWQQATGGGFFHASAEYEPTYTPEESCPIHQMMPALALLDYYEDQPENAPIRPLIQRALERHVAWFDYWWKRGNSLHRPLLEPGWCGVTNQDLVAVCALARYGAVFGDWKPFHELGIPALEVYLGPRFYHPRTGLFLRGDKPLFTERCSYLNIIAGMLHRIHQIHPDPRIPEILVRISATLVDAIYLDEEGNHHMSSGANDEQTNTSGQVVWLRDRRQISDYPEFLITLRAFGVKDSVDTSEKVEGLKRTLSSYVFHDGGLPDVLDSSNPLMTLAPSCYALAKLWSYLVSLYPDGVTQSEIPPFPRSRRQMGDMVFLSSPKTWEIHEKGRLLLRGIKQLPHGVLRPDEEMANYPFPSVEQVDFEEEIVLPKAFR